MHKRYVWVIITFIVYAVLFYESVICYREENTAILNRSKEEGVGFERHQRNVLNTALGNFYTML